MKFSRKFLKKLILEELTVFKKEVLVQEKLDSLDFYNKYYRQYGARQSKYDEASLNFEPSSEIDTRYAQRAKKLSKATGVPPAIVYALEVQESSHRPSAFAFNPRLFRNYVGDQNALAGEDKSVYGSEAQRVFKEAYKQDPKAAIKAGAWGLYQVLGATSLKLYGNDPERFLAAFKANPVSHSEGAFIAWVENAGPTWLEAVQNNDFAGWIGGRSDDGLTGYYGTATGTKGRNYIKGIKTNIAKWNGPEGEVSGRRVASQEYEDEVEDLSDFTL